MRLLEYKAKEIFRKYGIKTPEGKVAASRSEAVSIAKEFGKPVVVKAQIPYGGRGKAGAIRVSNTPEDAGKNAEALLGSKVRGVEVQKVLVEEKMDMVKEHYVAVTIDRREATPLLMVSSMGGVEVEELTEKHPDRLAMLRYDLFEKPLPYQIMRIVGEVGIDMKLAGGITGYAVALSSIFRDYDCEIVEINPLAVTKQGELYAADAVINIDDDALFRHKDLDVSDEKIATTTERERELAKAGVPYIEIGGDIGCVVNGAGMSITTLDVLTNLGVKPANFCDIGGGKSAEQIEKAFDMMLARKDLKVIVVSFHAGFSRCDYFSEGFIKAMKKAQPNLPIYIRLGGAEEVRGKEMLNQAFRESPDVFKVVKKVVSPEVPIEEFIENAVKETLGGA